MHGDSLSIRLLIEKNNPSRYNKIVIFFFEIENEGISYMNHLWVWILLLASLVASAQESTTPLQNSICDKFIESSSKRAETNNGNDISTLDQTGAILTLLFSPRSAVKMDRIALNIAKERVVVGKNLTHKKRYLFLGFPEVTLTKSEKQRYRHLKRQLKKLKRIIRKSDMRELLLEVTDKQECLAIVASHSETVSTIEILKSLSNKNGELLKRVNYAQTYKLAISKSAFLVRQGWTLIKNMTFTKAHLLMKKDGEQAIFLTHSTEGGELVDAKQHSFPKNYFNRIPTNINMIAVYSCYSAAVIDYYQIDSKELGYDYFHPTIGEKFNFIYRNSIPLLSFKTIKSVTKNNYSTFAVEQRDCSIKVKFQTDNDGYALYLDDKFISAISKDNQEAKIELSCSDIKDGTLIEIYRRRDSSPKISPEIPLDTSRDNLSAVVIDDEDISQRGGNHKLVNIYSKTDGRHIVSRYTHFNTKGDQE